MFDRSRLGLLTLALVSLFMARGAPVSAEAREQIKNGVVTACSKYSNGCYSAPLRETRLGPQMRLKGGTWVYCRGDCRDSLREDTIDFWETLRDSAGGND